MRGPNFFIIGAPKCGTTALVEYLRDHPRVFMSWPKEPHYFAEDFDRYRRIRTAKDYFDIFQPATNEHLAFGEASVWYLYSSVAVRNIRAYDPKAKLIVMLRNPVDFVHSLHNQLVYNFFETEKDFRAAWRLQRVRRRGDQIPRTCPEPAFLQYERVGKLGEQVGRVLDVFPMDQVKVILLDDFARSTRTVYEEVLGFLGVPSDGRTEFPKVNVRKRHRSSLLGRLLMNPPGSIRFLETQVRRSLRLLGVRNLSAWHRLIHANEQPLNIQPLPSDLRETLVKVFANDIERLSALIGRDLNHWFREPSSEPSSEPHKLASSP